MRIIAGEYRGRRLQAPKGDATRPTTDRVRESLMSALSSARGGFEGAVVLDAFAGSGALGLEALSRGAASAHFFEKDGVALRALCANVEALGVPTLGAGARARLHRDDVLERPPVWARPPFDLVLLDPPYALPAESALSMVAVLAGAGALAPEAIVSYEHAAAANGAADAAAAAGAIGGDLSGVGREVVGRVLGGDPALDGIPLDVQVVLCVAPQVRGYCRGSVEAVVRGGSRDPRARRRVAVVRGAAAVPAPEEGKRSIR